MSVITVSREYGSRGRHIARQVAQDLGYSYFDKNILTEVAHAANTTAAQISRYDEKCENGLRGFLKKLFAPEFSRYLDFPYYYYPSEFLMEGYPVDRDPVGEEEPIPTEAEVLEFFRRVIEKLWKRNNVVIVGRGSQMILADKPSTLHVRFIAPIEDRIEQVMKDEGVIYPLARKEIETTDKQRTNYLRHYYDADWADGKHYNLVLNTSSMSIELAAKVIITAVRHQEDTPQSGGPVEMESGSDSSSFSDSIPYAPTGGELRYNPRTWG